MTNIARLFLRFQKKTALTAIDSIKGKIKRGLRNETNQTFLHTGPHHDDILLGILPFIGRHIQEEGNKSKFAVMTSGFNAVTNSFVIKCLNDVKNMLDAGEMSMVKYPDFFKSGYRLKRDKDVYHFVTNIAAADLYQQKRGLCHRLVRDLIETHKSKQSFRVISVH